jgi:hypothetical protein
MFIHISGYNLISLILRPNLHFSHSVNFSRNPIMKTKIQILAAERRENVYEGNRRSVTYNCQCVVYGEKIEVGTLRVSLALVEPWLKDDQLPPGWYELEYGLAVSFQDRSIGGRLKSINPAADSVKTPAGHISQPVKSAA